MYYNFTDSELEWVKHNFKNKHTKEESTQIFKDYWNGRVIMIDEHGNEIPQLVWN